MNVINENLLPDYGLMLREMNAKKGAKFVVENVFLESLILMDSRTVVGSATAYCHDKTYILTLQFPRKWFKHLRTSLKISGKKFSYYFGTRRKYPGPLLQLRETILITTITVTLGEQEQSALTGEIFIPANVIPYPINRKLRNRC